MTPTKGDLAEDSKVECLQWILEDIDAKVNRREYLGIKCAVEQSKLHQCQP